MTSVRKTATQSKSKHKMTKHKSIESSHKTKRTFSGKFSVRVPKSLQQEVVAAAEREGVSFNRYVTLALYRAIGVSKNKNSDLGPMPK